MSRSRITAALAVAATAALLLGGCSAGGANWADSPTGTPQRGGTVHMLQTADFSYLDPARGFDGGVGAFYRLLYRGLTATAPGDSKDPNRIVPDLAQALGEHSSDLKTWTYKLKPGLKFETGAPITSAEMKFGISRAWDPQIGIGSPYLKAIIDAPADYKGPYTSGDLPTIETPDASTIVFHLKTPFSEFDNVVAQANAVPFPKGTGGGDKFIKKPIASGPYRVAKFTPGSVIRLQRNPYWSAKTDSLRKAYPDAWQFDIGIEGATIDERMVAGQGQDADAISPKITPATLARIQTPQLKPRTLTAKAFCLTYMGMNTTKAPFKDVRVRQAVNYALDRAAVRNASGGRVLADVATTIIAPAITGHRDYDLYPSAGNKGDVAKAKALLAEAGLADGFDMTLDLRADPTAQAQAEAIQQSLQRIGARVKLNVIDTSIYYETIGTPSKQTNAAITGWCPDWASSASTVIPTLFDGRLITQKGNNNLAQINDDGINSAIDAVKRITDPAQAATAYGQLDETVMKQAPIAPLAFENGVFVAGSNIAGYHPSTNQTDLSIIGLRDPGE